jgi:hypothetical protein
VRQKRIPVRCCGGDGARSQGAARADAILKNEWLANFLAGFLEHNARHDIHRTTGCERHEDTNRFVRPFVGVNEAEDTGAHQSHNRETNCSATQAKRFHQQAPPLPAKRKRIGCDFACKSAAKEKAKRLSNTSAEFHTFYFLATRRKIIPGAQLQIVHKRRTLYQE